MIQYLFFRLLRWVPSLLVLLLMVYALAFFGAGDPIKLIFLRAPGDVAYDEARVEAMREEAGIDRPFLIQFGAYLGNLFQGNLGNSLVSGRSVNEMIRAAAPVSLQLGLAAVVVMAVVGIPLGVIASLNQNNLLDNIILSLALVIWSVPPYVAGPLLMVFLVTGIGVMNVPYGWDSIFSTNAILPLAVLSLQPLALIIRQTRASVIETLGEDYIRTARSKGLPEMLITWRHIVRPVLTPVVTQLGLIMITIINGAILVETVFGLPGLGRLTVSSTIDADYPVILAIALIGSFLVMVSNLLVDLIYPLLDPRATTASLNTRA